jgi:quinol monooxygenase YgiN
MAEHTPDQSDVITLTGVIYIKPEHAQDYERFAISAARQIKNNEPGTLLYLVQRHPIEPHAYIFVERYRDDEAMKAHSSSPLIREAMKNLREWCVRPPEVLTSTQSICDVQRDL